MKKLQYIDTIATFYKQESYTISFCPRERACLRQRDQKTDLAILSWNLSLKDAANCNDSGGAVSKSGFMNSQNLSNCFSYL